MVLAALLVVPAGAGVVAGALNGDSAARLSVWVAASVALTASVLAASLLLPKRLAGWAQVAWMVTFLSAWFGILFRESIWSGLFVSVFAVGGLWIYNRHERNKRLSEAPTLNDV